MAFLESAVTSTHFASALRGRPGTRFAFRFGSTAGDSPHAPGGNVSAPRTVLYVEDHPINVLLMRAVFARRPALQLAVATTGAEGLCLATLQPPDLLLLDLRLPDCHGSELLRRMRAEPALCDVPAIAVTAEDPGPPIGDCFDEVWQKPLDLKSMLQRLDHWLGGAAPQCRCSGGRLPKPESSDLTGTVEYSFKRL
ncbi:MAG TPA: response regulator [Albitalea sp.]|nr:response regulator [Albitalea sp.]